MYSRMTEKQNVSLPPGGRLESGKKYGTLWINICDFQKDVDNGSVTTVKCEAFWSLDVNRNGKRERKREMKKDNRKKSWLKLLLLFCLLVLTGQKEVTVQAAVTGVYTLTVDGNKDYSQAYKALEYINEERVANGAGRLVMDQELLDAAMQRAAECSVYFNHVRADGSSYLTVSSKVMGENIAAGILDAQGAFDVWKNSSQHYENMKNSRWKSTGVGCFKIGSLTYWVQLFSTQSASAVTSRDDSEQLSVHIADSNSSTDGLFFNMNQNGYGPADTVEIVAGETDQLSVGRVNGGWTSKYCEFKPSSFSWKSSNPSAVRVDGNGKVTALGGGTAKITATPKSIVSGTVTPATVTYHSVQSIEQATIDAIPDQTYTGSPLTPKVTVRLNGKILKEGTDYKLEYFDNTNVYNYNTFGQLTSPKVWVSGIGNYGGSVRKTFNILPVNAGDQFDVKIKGWDTAGYENMGDGLLAQIEVSYQGRKLSNEKGDFYIASYSPDGTKVASFTIRLQGNYTGSRSFESLEKSIVKAADQKYTGKPLTPNPRVYINDRTSLTLKKGVDYTVSYRNNTQRGTATVIVTGKGEYYGKCQGTFEIGCSHSWNAWKTTKAPTALAGGVKQRTCKICGASQKAAIAKLTPTLTLSHSQVTLKKGSALKTTVKKKAAGDYVVSWTSNAKSVATVGKDGVIRAVGKGTAQITCRMKSGIAKQIRVTVTVPTTKLTVRCTGATLKAGKITMSRGKTARLLAARQPLDTSDKLTFKSTNAAAVQVNASGYLKALKKGTAKITVKSGVKTVTITVTVK